MSIYKPIPEGKVSSQIAILQDLYLTHFGYKQDGYFVEIGAFDGFSWSNTLCLIDAGWSGIMVEPNPEMFNKLNERHGKNPKLQLMQLAIGEKDGSTKLYLGGSLSTIKVKSVRDYPNIQGMNFTGLDENKHIEVSVLTMDSLLARCSCPPEYDVLVVDVEGAEMDVLRGYDIDRWRPRMVIIEAHEKHPDERLNWKAPLIADYFKQYDYEAIHADIVNTIYIYRRK